MDLSCLVSAPVKNLIDLSRSKPTSGGMRWGCSRESLGLFLDHKTHGMTLAALTVGTLWAPSLGALQPLHAHPTRGPELTSNIIV